MNNNEILEGNKLIAEFMGYEKVFLNNVVEEWLLGSQNNASLPSLKFYSSWDWLMPVVNKIFDITDSQMQAFAGLSIFELGLTSPIEEVWLSVVEFIKWHNSKSPA